MIYILLLIPFLFGFYLFLRIEMVSRLRRKLIAFAFEDMDKWPRKSKWYDGQKSFDGMMFTFWVWPISKLVTGEFRSEFLQWLEEGAAK